MKKNQKTQNNQRNVIFSILGTLVVAWLIVLTIAIAWFWNQHMWQAKVHSDSIYQLMVENGKQQAIIDELSGN
jgi:hypothetical protein